MHSYAQTNIQLFNQLRGEGYSNTDLTFIRDAYELAMILFTGRFQPSGKSFIAHVVGTASILASLGLPATAVAAGLLHNVYENGDFGKGVAGITTAKRQEIRRVLGPEVEEYLARFSASYWESPTIHLARDNPDQLSAIDREVLLILLADHLEHLLDLDILYYGAAGRRYCSNDSRIAAEIAERLGVSPLAAELETAVQATESAELPVELSKDKIRYMSFVIAPNSCRRRLSLVLRSAPFDKLRRLSSQFLRKIKRLYANRPSS